MLLWFDPEAQVSIAAGAMAAYAANPLPQLPVSQFIIRGGTVYAGAQGYDNRTWKPEALWMPRFSFGYKLGEKNVIKGGYGMYYDTLNARDFTPDQQGYDVATVNPVSNDFGLTWALGDPKNGICHWRSLPGGRDGAIAGASGPRSASRCWAGASRPKTPTACTRACSGGGLAGSGN
jgi:hypothetical protein